MLAFTERLTPPTQLSQPLHTLALTAEERNRTRHRFKTPDGETVALSLPRGTVLHDGDILRSPTGELLHIIAQPETLLTVTARNPLDLLRAAYHLGNRHVPLEITSTYLRLCSDSVLRAMLEQMGLDVREEVVPFYPEVGAYRHSH
ncbi:MAG: urease accessory protein UreE [Cyanobacteriota bacterium]|nr:urease accessory protein UreE [Cyanobacteriota bacterium]